MVLHLWIALICLVTVVCLVSLVPSKILSDHVDLVTKLYTANLQEQLLSQLL